MSELAARVRAARAYKGINQQELADELGVDVQTVKRRESGNNDPKKGEQRAIAAICGVPKDFFDTSKPLDVIGPFELAERVQLLADRLEQLEGRVSPLAELDEDETRTLRDLLRRRNGQTSEAEAPEAESPGEG